MQRHREHGIPRLRLSVHCRRPRGPPQSGPYDRHGGGKCSRTSGRDGKSGTPGTERARGYSQGLRHPASIIPTAMSAPRTAAGVRVDLLTGSTDQLPDVRTDAERFHRSRQPTAVGICAADSMRSIRVDDPPFAPTRAASCNNSGSLDRYASRQPLQPQQS